MAQTSIYIAELTIKSCFSADCCALPVVSLSRYKPTRGVCMFTVTPNGENRLDIELTGKLDAIAMKVALDEMVSESKDIEHGKMLYQISDFDLPSLGALAVELSRLPSLFALIRKFDRVAVLADKAWIKKISEIEGALFPGLEIKAFDPDEKIAAEAWLSD